jgi:hypothetical protein
VARNWRRTHSRRPRWKVAVDKTAQPLGAQKGSRLVGLALRPEFRLKARSPSNEPSGARDDMSRGKQSSSCRASRAAWPVPSARNPSCQRGRDAGRGRGHGAVPQCCFWGGREDDPEPCGAKWGARSHPSGPSRAAPPFRNNAELALPDARCPIREGRHRGDDHVS